MTAKRQCLRDPVAEISEAASYLDEAISAHLAGDLEVADQLIRRSNMPAIREWTESIWGPNKRRFFRKVLNAPPSIPERDRAESRMPNSAEKRELLRRDAFHCRFCGIPVIRKEVRVALHRIYPDALPWGGNNSSQHAAFQAMWVQYDHLLPHAHGGTNDLENIVIACAPCNYGRGDKLLEEVGLIDPMLRKPVASKWDGLERLFY